MILRVVDADTERRLLTAWNYTHPSTPRPGEVISVGPHSDPLVVVEVNHNISGGSYILTIKARRL